MFDKICVVIAETVNCNIDEITKDTNLQDDLGLDSLDAVELNMSLEDKFEISITDEELAELKTVGDIVNVVNSKLSK